MSAFVPKAPGTVDMDALRADPRAIAVAAFGEGGTMSLHMPGFRHNPSQVDYVEALLVAALKGGSTAGQGIIAMVEGSTGSGKTAAYVFVAMLMAALSGPVRKRAVIATYTRQLLTQVMRESVIVSAVVERMTGLSVSVAPYRSRKNFVSVSKANHLIDMLTASGRENECVALEALIYLDQRAKLLLSNGDDDDRARITQEVIGTLDAFPQEHPDLQRHLGLLAVEQYCLGPHVRDEAENALWRHYQATAKRADVLVVTHVALAQDLSIGGNLFGLEDPYAIAVVDEAHRLPDAVQTVMSESRSIREIAAEAAHVRDGFEENPEWDHPELREAAEKAVVSAAALLKDVQDFGVLNQHQATVVRGDEAWLERMAKLRGRLEAFATLVKPREGLARFGVESDMHEIVLGKIASIDAFLACIDWRRRNAARRSATVPEIHFSPMRKDPTFKVKPVFRMNVMNRLWGREDGKLRRMADAVVLTSATLSDMRTDGVEGMSRMAKRLGVSGSVVLDRGCSRIVEQRDFGKPTYRIAHPKAPNPSEKAGSAKDGPISEGAAAYTAHAVSLARADNPGRVLVLAQSKRDSLILSAAIRTLDPGIGDHLTSRDADERLADCLDRFRADPGCVLVAFGAQTGVDLPGLVDNLVIPRLPYPPPDDEGNFADTDLNMMITLRQMLGRAIRCATDAPWIWVCDPRFGLPGAVQRNEPGIAPLANSSTAMSAVDRRHKAALDRARIIPLPVGLEPAKPAVAKRNARRAA